VKANIWPAGESVEQNRVGGKNRRKKSSKVNREEFSYVFLDICAVLLYTCDKVHCGTTGLFTLWTLSREALAVGVAGNVHREKQHGDFHSRSLCRLSFTFGPIQTGKRTARTSFGPLLLRWPLDIHTAFFHSFVLVTPPPSLLQFSNGPAF